MKLIGYTKPDFENYNYKVILDPIKQRNAELLIIEDLRLHNYIFGGTYHQYGYGIPVFDNNKVFFVSMRSWGHLMADAVNTNSNNDYTYFDFAWIESCEGHPTPESDNRIISLDELIKSGCAVRKSEEELEQQRRQKIELEKKIETSRIEHEKLKNENPEEWKKLEEQHLKIKELFNQIKIENIDIRPKNICYNLTDEEKNKKRTL